MIGQSFFSRTAEIAARIASPLGKFFSFSLADESIAPGQCLAVHLDRGGVDLAHGTRFLSRLTIKGTRHYPFEAGEYPSPEAFASTVHLAISDLRAGQADITLIIPKAWTIVKKADFPLVVRETLANVVRYELDRLTPLSPEQAYYDYQVIGEDEGRLQIILAAVKAETLDPYLAALAQRGIRVKRVIVSLAALGALSHHAHGGETTAFLEVHPAGYEGGVIDGKGMWAAFSGNLASAAERERAGAIAAVINPLLETLRKAGKAATLFVDSKTGSWPLLSESIHAPVRFFGSTDLRLRFLQQKTAPLYTALGGIVESLQTGFRGPNLLDKGVHPSSRTPLALSVFLLVVLAGLGLFAMAASLQIETRKAEAIEREIAARTPEVKKIEALQKERAALEKEIRTVEEFKTLRPLVMSVFRELTLVLPRSVWLARVRVTDATVNIEGYATAAPDLLAKLEASRLFKKVEFSSPTFRDARMNADRFAIKMEIEGLPEEKVKNEKK